MFNFLTPLIGIGATIFAVSSTVPQIVKGLKTKKNGRCFNLVNLGPNYGAIFMGHL